MKDVVSGQEEVLTHEVKTPMDRTEKCDNPTAARILALSLAQHGKLFHVQDNDRPLYVIAGSWASAVSMWKEAVALENDMEISEMDEPAGIQLVADEQEWIFSDQLLWSTPSTCQEPEQ